MLADKVRAFDPDLPLERATTIPASWYRDADIYEAERTAVFSSGEIEDPEASPNHGQRSERIRHSNSGLEITIPDVISSSRLVSNTRKQESTR